MATTTTIPDQLARFPCVLTNTGLLSFYEADKSTLSVNLCCQQALNTDAVDIEFTISKRGTWLLDINKSAYKDRSGVWYQLKPNISKATGDRYGTATAQNSGGDEVGIVFTRNKPQTFILEWDASDYSSLLNDPVVEIKIVFVKHEKSDYYTHRTVSIVGDNDQGVQTAITEPSRVDTWEKMIDYTFNKGYTEPPHSVEITDNGIKFKFSVASSGICNCYTVCGKETVQGLCPDGSTFNLQIGSSALTTEIPFRQNVTLEDGLGNESTFVARSLHLVTPAGPTATHTPATATPITVTVDYDKGIYTLSDDARWYKIERYIGSDNNRETLVDWTEVTGTDSVSDPMTKLLQGETYGYRVRLKTASGTESIWSAWSTVTWNPTA